MVGRRALGLGILLLTGSVAWADGYWPWCQAPVRPIVVCPPIACCPSYAVPTAAPPSEVPALPGQMIPKGASSKEPPLGKTQSKGPVIDSVRTVSGLPPYAEPRQVQCKVSFWNLSGYDVQLIVNDKTYSVGKDRAQVLTIDRQFTWRTHLHDPKTEIAPDDSNHFEVLIK